MERNIKVVVYKTSLGYRTLLGILNREGVGCFSGLSCTYCLFVPFRGISFSYFTG